MKHGFRIAQRKDATKPLLEVVVGGRLHT
jgi:hypothetical protein